LPAPCPVSLYDTLKAMELLNVLISPEASRLSPIRAAGLILSGDKRRRRGLAKSLWCATGLVRTNSGIVRTAPARASPQEKASRCSDRSLAPLVTPDVTR